MDYLAFKLAYEDLAQVLLQYTISKTVDRDVLKEQFSTLLCSFVKKEHFYNIMTSFLSVDYNVEDIKTQWENMLKAKLNELTFVNDTNYTDQIIERVKECYKIK